MSQPESTSISWARWRLWWKLMLASFDVLIFPSEVGFHFHLMNGRCYPAEWLPSWMETNALLEWNSPVSSLMYYLLLNVFIYTQLLHKLSCHLNGGGLICCHASLGEWNNFFFFNFACGPKGEVNSTSTTSFWDAVLRFTPFFCLFKTKRIVIK